MLMYAPAGFSTDLNSCLFFLQYSLSALLEKGGGGSRPRKVANRGSTSFLTAALLSRSIDLFFYVLGSWVASTSPGGGSVQRWDGPRAGRCEWLLPLRSAAISKVVPSKRISRTILPFLVLVCLFWTWVSQQCIFMDPLLRSFFLPDYRSFGDG
ncbi:unnamed protein product [Ectocarpus sp. 12 AP-2014]